MKYVMIALCCVMFSGCAVLDKQNIVIKQESLVEMLIEAKATNRILLETQNKLVNEANAKFAEQNKLLASQDRKIKELTKQLEAVKQTKQPEVVKEKE